MNCGLRLSEMSNDDQLSTTDDLPPITEETTAAVRAEYEFSVHAVEPSYSNKFVVFHRFQLRCIYFYLNTEMASYCGYAF